MGGKKIGNSGPTKKKMAALGHLTPLPGSGGM